MAPEDADFTLKFDGLVVDPNSTPDVRPFARDYCS
jgi:hypothetical protein